MGVVLVADSACVQEQDFLIVERAVWFDDSCVLSDTTASPTLVYVDVSVNTEIGMGFLLTNTQTQNANSTTGIDDTEIQLETASVSLSFSGGGVSPSSFEVPIASESISGGDTNAILVHLHSSVAESLRATMMGLPAGSVEHLEMEVIFNGRKTGQIGNTKIGTVESRAFVFPFEICYGCLTSAGCLPATECGGAATDPDVCPTPTSFIGSCGFAQFGPVYNATCTPPA